MGSTPRSRTLGTSASKVPNVGTSSRSFVCNGSKACAETEALRYQVKSRQFQRLGVQPTPT